VNLFYVSNAHTGKNCTKHKT